MKTGIIQDGWGFLRAENSNYQVQDVLQMKLISLPHSNPYIKTVHEKGFKHIDNQKLSSLRSRVVSESQVTDM